MDCSPPGSSVHGIFPGESTGVGCHILLQGIFLTQGSNPSLLCWQAGSLPLSHLGSQDYFISTIFGFAFCYGHRWALAPDDVAGTLPCALSSHINTAASNIFGHAPSRSQERISLGSHPRVELLGDSYLQHFIWLSQTLIFTRFVVLKWQLIVKIRFFF